MSCEEGRHLDGTEDVFITYAVRLLEFSPIGRAALRLPSSSRKLLRFGLRELGMDMSIPTETASIIWHRNVEWDEMLILYHTTFDCISLAVLRAASFRSRKWKWT